MIHRYAGNNNTKKSQQHQQQQQSSYNSEPVHAHVNCFVTSNCHSSNRWWVFIEGPISRQDPRKILWGGEWKVNSRYFEKVTKIWKISLLYLTLISRFKKVGRFLQFFGLLRISELYLERSCNKKQLSTYFLVPWHAHSAAVNEK